MFTHPTQINNQPIHDFDQELLLVLKSDLQNQRAKIKTKIMNLATINFDKALFKLIKEDLYFIRMQLSNQQNLAIAI